MTENVFYCPVCDSVLTLGTLDEEEYIETYLNCPVCDFDIIGSGDTAEEAIKFLMEEYKYYKEEEML